MCDKEYYEEHPEKRATVEELHIKYMELLMGQIHSKKETLPKNFNPSDDYYKYFEGKIIKDILYNQVDILDGNVFDTTKTSTTYFGRFLNRSYTPTKNKVPKNESLIFPTLNVHLGLYPNWIGRDYKFGVKT